jgi:hypothetical protein
MIEGQLLHRKIEPTPIAARTILSDKLILFSSFLFRIHSEFPLLVLHKGTSMASGESLMKMRKLQP